MNGDVANLVMDKKTTQALGGVVVIDHYVGTPEELAADIKKIAEKSGGKVVLGEFGAPIPDIHGNLSMGEQAIWIEDALKEISDISDLIGVNYWVSFGGSTRLWEDNYSPRKASQVLDQFFKPKVLTGYIKDERGKPIKEAFVSSSHKRVVTTRDGEFSLSYLSSGIVITVEAEGYITQQTKISGDKLETILIKGHESLLFMVQKFLYKLMQK